MSHIDFDEIVAHALCDRIDSEYLDGRQTTLSTYELEDKIAELSGGRFSKL